jgi:hypothetical protein
VAVLLMVVLVVRQLVAPCLEVVEQVVVAVVKELQPCLDLHLHLLLWLLLTSLVSLPPCKPPHQVH